MHIRRVIVAGVIAAAMALAAVGGATAAYAQAPVTFGSAHVIDEAGALKGDASAVENAAKTLADQHGVNLYVAYVDTFTSPSDARSWALTTAQQNHLTPNDYLLSVAIGSRYYYFSGDT